MGRLGSRTVAFDLQEDAFSVWQRIGITEGLSTHLQTACFLIQQYENREKSISSPTRCRRCQSQLLLTCPECHWSASTIDSKVQNESTLRTNSGLAQNEHPPERTSSSTEKQTVPEGKSDLTGNQSSLKKKSASHLTPEGKSDLTGNQSSLKKKSASHLTSLCSRAKRGQKLQLNSQTCADPDPDPDSRPEYCLFSPTARFAQLSGACSGAKWVNSTNADCQCKSDIKQACDDEMTVVSCGAGLGRNKLVLTPQSEPLDLPRTEVKFSPMVPSTHTSGWHHGAKLEIPVSLDRPLLDKSQTYDEDEKDNLPLVFTPDFHANSHHKKWSEEELETMHEKHYSCTKCETAFKWKPSLREHLYKVHSVREVFPCKMCDQLFLSGVDVKRHMQTHKHLKSAKKHFCTECGASFHKAWDLRLHTRRHTNERPFVCLECGHGFRTKDKLKIHMRCHTDERPYVCSQCGARFRQSGILRSHMRTHTGEKPYVCQVCHVGFAQSSALKTHFRTHSGEKTHMCSVCGAGFAASSRLDRHMRVHTGARPYICSQCGSGFKSSRELNCHIRTHTKDSQAICKVCGSVFSQAGYLKIHMRIHTNEKPYVCQVCSMAFRQSSGLKMHMLKHTDERPCVCKMCGAAFRRSYTLKNHMQKKHSGET